MAVKDRVLITYPASEIPFLPPFDDFLRLVVEGGMASVAKQTAHETGKNAPSEKTLRKSILKPITRSTANQILEIFTAKLPDSVDLERLGENLKPWVDLRLRSNGASWLPAMMGLRDVHLKEKLPGSRTEQFVYSRVDAEYEFLVEIRPILLDSPVEPKQKLFRQAFQRLLSGHTVVDQPLIDEFFKLNVTEQPPSIAGKRIEKRLMQEIRIDFYYQLLSNLSLDICEQLKEQGVDVCTEEKMAAFGFVGELAPVPDAKGQFTRPFARLLDQWRSTFSSNRDQPLSWRKLSMAIPHPIDSEIAQCDPETQYCKDLRDKAAETKKARLREWRNGVRPHLDQLEQFLENLLPEDGDRYYCWTRAQLALIWGALIDREKDLFDDADTGQLIHDSLLFRYQDVWQLYKSQADKIMSA